uniref:Uncharacterized protein n=1 Tax=Roseihalotalea indica TaxID=2867963 RepID=A0AA49JG52_9BACT|nr:hypothetical protein K4G66_12085 [Tunicatimonas sp. TK19036]
MKLDRNGSLKSLLEYNEDRKTIKSDQYILPDNLNFSVFSITFLDCIQIEDSNRLKKRLLKTVSQYKHIPYKDPSRELRQSFDKFDSAYKTTSWGNLFDNSTKGSEELDLIDRISYGYIKGEESHFILTYTVYPSKKFQALFDQSLRTEVTKESEIIFKSFKQIIKNKKLSTSVSFRYKKPSYWTEKILNEINFQLKSKVLSGLKFGIFNSRNDVLFPRIITFEYDKNEFASYKNDLFQKLNINRHEHYSNCDTIFTLKDVDYSKTPSASIELFFPLKSDEEKRKDQFNDTSQLSVSYTQAIAPLWMVMNVASLNKQNLISLQRKIFVYIRKNKVSMFLNKAIKLKNKLLLEWIEFERLREDFSTKFFSNDLLIFNGIPDAKNAPRSEEEEPAEYKMSLARYSKYLSLDIKKSFEKLLDLFKHVSEDNSVRANMQLQRLLLWIAIIGVVLAIYGTNSEWFNLWIKNYLSRLDVQIPRTPTQN